MAKGKLYQVTVKAFDDPTKPKGVGFSMQSSLLSAGRLKFYKNSNNMKAEDFYLLDFILDDRTNAGGLAFVSDLDQVLWTKATTDPTECINAHPGGNFSEFRAVAVPVPTNLLVVNYDSTSQLFAFALNFVRGAIANPTPADFITYDPIGDNKNGGVAYQASTIAAGVAVLAVTATAVSVAAINGAW